MAKDFIPNYGKAAPLLEAVSIVKIRRLTNTEMLQTLEDMGFPISLRKLERVKVYLKTHVNQRLNYIASQEYAEEHLQSIDTAKGLREAMLAIVYSTTANVYQRIRAAEVALQSLKTLDELYDSNPIVAHLVSKMDNVQKETS